MSKKHDIIWFESLDSTNNEAARRIAELDNLSVVAALEQTAGRGQGDHTWLSPRGANLLFSIVLKFEEGSLAAKDSFSISEAASGAMVEFLGRHGIQAWVKPPNDIYVGEKKICGTLIENTFRGAWVSNSIIGIGLNVNQRNFDVSLPNPTSMALETGLKYDIDTCLGEVMGIFRFRWRLRGFLQTGAVDLAVHGRDYGGWVFGFEDCASGDEDFSAGLYKGAGI